MKGCLIISTAFRTSRRGQNMYEISPDIVKTVRNDIIHIIRGKADEYSDFNNLLMLLKQKAKPWELIPVIAFYAETLFIKGTTDSERMALFDLIESEEESLESENTFLSIASERTPADRLRVLFYTQLALSSILLIKSKMEFNESNQNPNRYAEYSLLRRRGISIIHEMSVIKSFIHYEQFPYSAAHAPTVHHDIAESKLAANDFIYSLLITDENCNPAEYLYYAAETWKERLSQPHSQYWNTFEVLSYFPFLDKGKFDTFVINIFSAIDLWTKLCEKEDEKEKSFPTLKWFDLITGISSFLPNSTYDLGRVDSPSDCSPTSSQYLCWKLGHIVGKFVKSGVKAGKSLSGIQGNLIDEAIKQSADYKTIFIYDSKEIYKNLPIIIQILEYCHENVDWQTNKKRAIALWKSFVRTDQISLNQITPATDLFWAIICGLSDSLLTDNPVPLIPDNEVIKSERANAVSELPVNLDLNPMGVSGKEIENELRRRLGNVYDNLPHKILELLKSCRENCNTNVGIKHSITDFDLAVRYWMQLLLTFSLDKEASMINGFNFIKMGQRTLSPSDLSNVQWGRVFKDSYKSVPNDPNNEYSSYRIAFENYIKKNISNVTMDTLKSISEQLLDIGGIRNKVIHEGDRDITERQMRKYLLAAETLVLGTDAKQGLIVNLSLLFRNNGNFVSDWNLSK
jgi:hypothetical protein